MVFAKMLTLLCMVLCWDSCFGTEWDGLTPWFSGSQCHCNGYSTRCMFDQKLYDETGHGGHCLDCNANRDGPNCERCRPNYYMREDGYCTACMCDKIGSLFQQCNAKGKCQCKSGVTGDKCDRCAENHYDFSKTGCKSCGCYQPGSVFNTPRCDSVTGHCYCKDNVEGRQCHECKPGFFNLHSDNKFGCTPCFCYGHSSQCKSAPGYFSYLIESTFAKSSEKWKAQDQYGRNIPLKFEGISQSIGVQSKEEEAIYFVAPQRFLGDHRASYNQLLDFSLRVGDSRPIPTATDVVLESAHLSISNTIFAQDNRIPSMETQNYKFRLHEHPDYGWQPRMDSRSFISLLTNLTAIKIKGTFAPRGVGFLDDVKLETASRGIAGKQALWIELCDCPTGYVGAYCESCAPGYRHYPPHGGPFTSCIPCDCNSHASICESETGRCICQHNTTGENCEFCARGYYGNALAGTPEDCLPCGCPEGGPCIQLGDEEVICIECPVGYSGPRCDICSDGFYGDPTGRFGPKSPCEMCECNDNIDTNAIGNCNTTTGECLRCIHNTGGSRCEVCLEGYFGNALVLPKGDCERCQCYPPGTEDNFGEPICDQSTGACQCRPHVIGNNCDECENGYFNIASLKGCDNCNCDPVGSYNRSCNLKTGQCFCRPGVTGLRCDHCEAEKYGFSLAGCKDCECDIIGSKDLQCDSSGQCPCLDNVEGRKCDRCKENKFDRKRGCVDCPDCYNLVQTAHRNHTSKLSSLEQIINEIEHQPIVVSDEEFSDELEKLENEIDDFSEMVRNGTGNNSIYQEILNIKKRGNDISTTLDDIYENIYAVTSKMKITQHNLDNADDFLLEVEERLNEAEEMFEIQAKKALQEARERSKVVGQQSQRMTNVAHEARTIADLLDETADAVISKSMEAKNKSIEAYEKVKQVHAMQQNVSDDVRKLQNDVATAEAKLNRTKEWTEEVSEEANEVKNAALALLNDVNNLIVPQTDIPSLKQRSNDLRDEANRLVNKTRELFDGTEQLRSEIIEQNEWGYQLIEDSLEQQEEIENLRNDLELSESQASRAIDLWNDILTKAETNFKLLSDFDIQTNKSKKEAMMAIESIPVIEQIIINTNNKTDQAQDALVDAKYNAALAWKKANEADELAKSASNKADAIKEEAEGLFKNTTQLSNEAELMYDRVLNSDNELRNLLDKARSNDSLVNEAKEKVGRAGRDANAAQNRVAELLKDVESIVNDLQNTPEISDDELTKLEEQIHRTEFALLQAKLDERLMELQKKHKSQNDLIESYKDQIKILRSDVSNIEEIVNSLPNGCYKRVELEP